MLKLLTLFAGLCVCNANICYSCNDLVKFSDSMLFDTKIPVYDLAKNITDTCDHNLQLVHNIYNFIGFISNPIKPIGAVCVELEYQMGYSGLYSNNSTCAMCKFITGIVRYQVQQANTTLTAIEDIIKAICATQPFIKKECYFYLDSIQDIINWIVVGLTDLQICKKLGMC